MNHTTTTTQGEHIHPAGKLTACELPSGALCDENACDCGGVTTIEIFAGEQSISICATCGRDN